jgi:O-antigen/teichoic acid export membrane protein
MNSLDTNPLRGAINLGFAGVVSYIVQFALPILLVRFLDSTEFGQYRLLWLIANSIMAFAPLALPYSLFFFLPRAKAEEKERLVANVLWFLIISGIISAAIGASINQYFEGSSREIPGNSLIVPLFILLWVVSSFIDSLANAEGRIPLQAQIITLLSLVRLIVVGTVAFLSGDIVAVLWAIVAFAGIKFALLLVMISKRYGINGFLPHCDLLKRQLIYAVPFGLSGSLYIFRGQGDQWIVASMFPVEMFAVFSVAGVVAPLANLVRVAVDHAVLQSINLFHGQGDLASAMDLNRNSNTLIALLLLPALTFLFIFANEIISIVFTPAYIDAVNPMRIYIFGVVGQVLIVNNLLATFEQGKFLLVLNIWFLLFSIGISYIGALNFGLQGAAFGTALAQWGSQIISILWVAKISKKNVNEFIDISALSQVFTIATLTGLIVFCIFRLDWFRGEFMSLILGAITFSLFYIPLVLLLPRLRRNLVQLFKTR